METTNTRRVRMRDIAEAAGVSAMTVSLALRNQSRISPPMRKLIKKIARKMGYQPDPKLSKLMEHLRARRTREDYSVIAWVTHFHQLSFQNEAFIRLIHKGVIERAQMLGYKVESFNVDDKNLTGRRLSQILYTRSIQGLIIGPYRDGIMELDIDYERFALATPGFQLFRPALSCTLPDEFNNMLICLRRLYDLGYRRIGFYTNQELNLRSGFRWSGAFLAAMAAFDHSEAPLLMVVDRILDEGSFRKWFSENRPDVVVSTERHVLAWLRNLGLNVPRDVGFASTGANEGWFSEPVSGINERVEFVGAAAVDLVSAQLHREECGIPPVPKVIMSSGIWTGDFTVRSHFRKQAREKATRDGEKNPGYSLADMVAHAGKQALQKQNKKV